MHASTCLDAYQHPAAHESLRLHRFSQASPLFAHGFAGAVGQQPPGKTRHFGGRLERPGSVLRRHYRKAQSQAQMNGPSSDAWTIFVVDTTARRERLRAL